MLEEVENTFDFNEEKVEETTEEMEVKEFRKSSPATTAEKVGAVNETQQLVDTTACEEEKTPSDASSDNPLRHLFSPAR